MTAVPHKVFNRSIAGVRKPDAVAIHQSEILLKPQDPNNCLPSGEEKREENLKSLTLHWIPRYRKSSSKERKG